MRTFYIQGQVVGLAEFLDEDYRLMYETWQDPVTQRNFNVKREKEDYDAFFRFFTDPNRPVFRFVTTIIRLEDGVPVGRISVSPEAMEPDLGIWIFKPFRGQRYGSEAVALAVTYLFETTGLDYVVIGIYEHNTMSRRLFEKVGFQPAPQYDEIEDDAFGDGKIKQAGFILERDTWARLQS